MKTHAYVYVFLFVCNERDRGKHHYSEYIIERQPKMIKGKQNRYQDRRESTLLLIMRCQISSEKQFFSYGSDNYVEYPVIYTSNYYNWLRKRLNVLCVLPIKSNEHFNSCLNSVTALVSCSCFSFLPLELRLAVFLIIRSR